MSKILNKKVLSVIALALVCVFAGTVIGGSQPSASAEEKVVLTSPFTEAIAKVRDSVVGVYNYQIVNTYGYGNGFGGSGYDVYSADAGVTCIRSVIKHAAFPAAAVSVALTILSATSPDRSG